jgi:hypothetical protein
MPARAPNGRFRHLVRSRWGRFLDGVERAAATAGISVWFIDGNHENFNLLYSLPLDADGQRPVRDHITHLPRGYRWTWAGRTMLACLLAVARAPWMSCTASRR